MEKVATVKEIAESTGLCIQTIRAYADKGLIESRRDFRGWRVFPEPLKTVRKIQTMLRGSDQQS